MHKLSFSCALAFALSCPLLVAQAPPVPSTPDGYDADLWRKAWRIHHDAFVNDTHTDTPSRIIDEGFDMGPRAADGHMDLVRMREGGLDAAFYSIYVAAQYYGAEDFKSKNSISASKPDFSAHRALLMIDGVLRTIARYPEQMVLCTNLAEIDQAGKAGKHATLMGIEGGHAIEGSLALLRIFHSLGVRYMTLTHTNHNQFADSCAEPTPRWGGLNALGERVVLEMNRLGMMVDVSHVSDATFFHTLKVTRAPVIFSHSSCRALCSHARNATDDMLKALAKNGGVIQINYNCGFIDPEYNKVGESRRAQIAIHRKAIDDKWPEDSAEHKAALAALNQRFILPPPPPLAKLIDHFMHAIKVAGIDHVGLGSDFDGVPCVPKGMDDVTYLPRLSYELLARGIDETGVRKILGGNLRRVMAAVEQLAVDLRHEQPR